MSNFELNQTVMDFYNLLGKQVSFVYKASSFFINTDGMVISVVLNLTGEHQFMIDSSPDFYSFSDVLEFQILD